MQRRRELLMTTRWTLVLAAVLPVAALSIVAMRRWPPIHDITTDVDDPPSFLAVLPYRTGRVSPPEYDGAGAAGQQRKAYPDVRPLIVSAPASAVFDAAAAVARGSGWQLVAADPAAGRIEAIATTPMMRFKDDVVIRVRANGERTRVDMRSKSRVGVGDLGTNARRIRAFLAALADRIG